MDLDLARRHRGGESEDCPSRGEPSHIGVRYGPARCCRHGAQEPADALSARSVLDWAACVIMVHMDELPLLKRLAAHAAGVLLRPQKQVKQFLGQPVARKTVLPVGLLTRLRRLTMRVAPAIQPVARHGLGCFARAAMSRSTGTCRLLSRHPPAAPLLPHSDNVDLRLFGLALRHA